jgi:tRNA (cmo5U34)-methyltransferase
MMSVQQAFNQASENYDHWVRKALPGFEELFGNAMLALPYPDEAPIHVLDLGAGTGLFSSFVLPRFPHAQFVLIDLAENMLDVAQKRFAAHLGQFSFMVTDIRDIDYQDEFDLVISSLAIHHLEHADKQALFQQVQRALKPEGIFLNIDQIHAPNEMLRTHYWSSWLQHVRSQGATQE